jgi:hypothetical protein
MTADMRELLLSKENGRSVYDESEKERQTGRTEEKNFQT